MKYVQVKFAGSNKIYTYKSNLSLMVGGTYFIQADGTTNYETPVVVYAITNKAPDVPQGVKIRELTSGSMVSAPKRPEVNAKVIINKDKGTTVIIWKDGTKTIVKCQPGEDFDPEKGVAMCFMKRVFRNRGCYNTWMKEALEANGFREE